MTKKKVIIDCDPGIDDTFALLFASQVEDFDIVAMTSVFGNQNITLTTSNLLALNELFGINAPIFKGSAIPLIQPKKETSDFHGENGVGGAILDVSTERLGDAYAWDAIYDLVDNNPNEITIVTLGPLTNIAKTILKYEDISSKIKEIVVMGGTTDIGNEQPFSEANVHNDSHAAKIVFNAGIPVTMVGLNATEHTRFKEEELEQLKNKIELNYPSLMKMVNHYYGIQLRYGDKELVIHDLAAMTVAADDAICTKKLYPVLVETNDSMMNGRSIVDLRPYSTYKPNISVVEKIDKEKFISKVLNMF